MVTETKTQAFFKTQLLNTNVPKDGTEGEGNGEGSGDGKPQKITFSKEQQDRVDQLIREAQGRASREVRQELETTKQSLQTLQQELEAAKVATKHGSSEDRKAAKGDVAELEAQIAEAKRASESYKSELERFKKVATDKEKEAAEARSEALNVRKRVAIQNAASKLNFVELEDVLALTERHIQWDAEKRSWRVMGDNGEERYNSAIEPMSLDEFYAELASKKPWMVRGEVKGGAGSAEAGRSSLGGSKYAVESIFGPKADAALANKLAKENYPEYKRLKEVARQAKLITW